MRGDGRPRARPGRGEFRVVTHPAGFDDQLRVALEDLRAGRWVAMREVLLRTGSDWTLRTWRTQVLAAAAARSTVVETWRAEEPGSVDALVMYARVTTERALRAHRERHHGAEELARDARLACHTAARSAQSDPVPWICLVALAEPDAGQRLPEHWTHSPERMLPAGPWGLLDQAGQRDPYNREAWHRMLQVLRSRGDDTLGYARWVASWAPHGSALLMLPLYVHAETYRSRRAQGATDGLFLYWSSQPVTYCSERALRGWFDASEPDTRSLLDLNHLAHALYAGGFKDEAVEVFHAVGPFATPAPWKYVSDNPERWQQQFLEARESCLPGVPDEPPPAGPHR
jgi:hypothetical protein